MPIVGLIFGVFGRLLSAIPWQVWVIIGVLVAAGIGLHMYKKEIMDAAYQQFYAAQVEQTLKAKQDEIDFLTKTQTDAEVIKQQLQTELSNEKTNNDQLVAQIRSLKRTVNGKTVILKDDKASEALQNAIDQIRTLNMARIKGGSNGETVKNN